MLCRCRRVGGNCVQKISPDEPEYLFTTRAERLSRTSPRYAYASPEPPGCRPGPGRNPAASSAVVVPGESSPVALGPSGLTVRTLYTYTTVMSIGDAKF